MTDDAQPFDPIPADGAGAEQFDQPALFYITHQATIEQWHGLRSSVAVALNEWFATTVHDALAPVAQDRNWELSSFQGPPGYTHILLHPRETPVLNHRPLVGIGVGWSMKGVNPVSHQPFACVRCSKSEPGKRAARILLDAGGHDFRTAQNLKGSDHDSWPIWWNIPASERWWTDLDTYRDTIVSEIARGVEGLANALSAAAAVTIEGSPEKVFQSGSHTNGHDGRS